MIFVTLYVVLPLLDVLYAQENALSGPNRLDCVKASEQCMKEQGCSTKYRTMRQCVAGGKERNFSMVAGLEAQDECRSAIDAVKQSPLYNCRCKRGMKKEKNCLRIYWGIYQTLQGNDFLEDSPYETMNSRLSDMFRLAPIISEEGVSSNPWSGPVTVPTGRGPQGRGRAVKDPSRNRRAHPNWAILGEPAVTRENNCLNAAKACNLNDTCKKYRSAYISPCTSRVSTAEVCNKRKCHKALRQFFDKVPPKHSYGMLFCSCPAGDQSACSERRRQTIVPVCSYEDKEKPNCLSLQASCKTNYICRSRLADFFANCQSEPRSLSGCLKENYADCLLSYSGLIGTVMTPNYLRSPKISVVPYCDCSSSGNGKEECDKFTEFFTDNTCLRKAIHAFGNGTDVGVWQPMPPVQTTTSTTTPSQKAKDRSPNSLDAATNTNHLNTGDESLYHFCGSLQAQKLKSNISIDGVLCVDPQIDDPGISNSISRNSAGLPSSQAHLYSLLLLLAVLLHCTLAALDPAAVL
ncbi:GDNF family receptor alpha-1a isoform X1 [Oncorhynchus mykiss]|uniref:Gdnf family receptor alpha 1a n=1 Tax=Oncorhynchus mykiss TaxID=8022 RepID=A0A8C7UII0_ONCMY|nr:GDNF family receptor alpha-1a isoform X1 [Oncorhynchus mykiss]XP_052331373.1 GDNF family receptor alpha-1-like isoform X1 [Oncorhynchus keta]